MATISPHGIDTTGQGRVSTTADTIQVGPVSSFGVQTLQTGIGAVAQLVGPTDQPFRISAAGGQALVLATDSVVELLTVASAAQNLYAGGIVVSSSYSAPQTATDIGALGVIGFLATSTTAKDTGFSRTAAATAALGTGTAATDTGTLQVATLGRKAETGTNTAGTSIVLAGGQGTGTGASGLVNIQVSPILGTGSTVQTLGTVMAFSGIQNNLSGTNNLASLTVTFADGSTTSTGTMRMLYLNPTINDTAASRTGSYTGIQLDAIETSASTGTNYLIRTRNGTAGTTDAFSVQSGIAGTGNTVNRASLNNDSTTAGNRPISQLIRFRSGGAVNSGDVIGSLYYGGGVGAGTQNFGASIDVTSIAAVTGSNTVPVVMGISVADTSGGIPIAFAIKAASISGTSGISQGWTSSTTDATQALDTAFSRLAAGYIAAGNGTSGDTSGNLAYRRFVSPQITNYPVLSTDTNKFFTNTGASGSVNFTLPTPVAGITYTFYVNAAQTVQVTAAASTTITIDGSTTSSGGNIMNSTTGSVVRLVAITRYSVGSRILYWYMDFRLVFQLWV